MWWARLPFASLSICLLVVGCGDRRPAGPDSGALPDAAIADAATDGALGTDAGEPPLPPCMPSEPICQRIETSPDGASSTIGGLGLDIGAIPSVAGPIALEGDRLWTSLLASSRVDDGDCASSRIALGRWDTNAFVSGQSHFGCPPVSGSPALAVGADDVVLCATSSDGAACGVVAPSGTRDLTWTPTFEVGGATEVRVASTGIAGFVVATADAGGVTLHFLDATLTTQSTAPAGATAFLRELVVVGADTWLSVIDAGTNGLEVRRVADEGRDLGTVPIPALHSRDSRAPFYFDMARDGDGVAFAAGSLGMTGGRAEAHLGWIANDGSLEAQRVFEGPNESFISGAFLAARGTQWLIVVDATTSDDRMRSYLRLDADARVLEGPTLLETDPIVAATADEAGDVMWLMTRDVMSTLGFYDLVRIQPP